MIHYFKRFGQNIWKQLCCIPEIIISGETIKYSFVIVVKTWIYILLVPILFVVLQNTINASWKNMSLKQFGLSCLFVIIPTIWGAIVSSSRMFRSIENKLHFIRPNQWNYCVCTSALLDVTKWMEPEILDFFANTAVVDECGRTPSRCSAKNLLRIFIVDDKEIKHSKKTGRYKWWCFKTIISLHNASKMKVAKVSKLQFQGWWERFFKGKDQSKDKDFAAFFNSVPASATNSEAVFVAHGSVPDITEITDTSDKNIYDKFASMLYNEIIDSGTGEVKRTYILDVA